MALGEIVLAAHLKGDYELFGDDLANSSVQVITGAEDVPSLREVLGS